MQDVRLEQPPTDRYMVDHLVVLVGGNPLPNYLAARQLLSPDGTIYPIYTAMSADVATQLLRAVIGKDDVQLPRRITGNDSVDVVEVVQRAIKAGRGRRIGLHYTGGTKRMAVHAYRAFLAGLRGQRGQMVVPALPLSYLNARTNLLYAHDTALTACHAWPIGAAVVTFDQLLRLHGRTTNERRPPLREPLLPAITKTLRATYGRQATREVWDGWLRGPRHPNDWLLPGYIANDNAFAPLLEALRGAGAYADGAIAIAALRRHLPTGTDPRDWLTSLWLESAVLDALISANTSRGLGLTEMLSDVHVYVTGSGGQDFQLDVVALHHHQVYVLSCKAFGAGEKRSELRLGLTEACVRARQIGGDEAHAALVCLAKEDDGSDLEYELRSDFDVLSDGEDARIKVFGLADLDGLPDKLTAWIADVPAVGVQP